MASSATHKEVIQLGRLLVEQLGQEPATDMTCRWMAHHVAELIVEAEKAKGTKKASARERCVRTILDLWERNAVMPAGRQPFENFTPILATLDAINPDNPTSYYLSSVRRRSNGSSTPDSTIALLDLAQSLDSAARVLIEFLLKEASERATDNKTRAFVTAAAKIPAGKTHRARVVKKLLQRAEALAPERGSGSAKELIKDRIAKLRTFAETCMAMESCLRESLGKEEAKICRANATSSAKRPRRTLKKR
jgi:hypothetical protein